MSEARSAGKLSDGESSLKEFFHRRYCGGYKWDSFSVRKR